MLTKLAAHHYLDERQIPYEIRNFPDTTEKGAANVAYALGFRERQMIKTLLFETDRGDHALIMVGLIKMPFQDCLRGRWARVISHWPSLK